MPPLRLAALAGAGAALASRRVNVPQGAEFAADFTFTNFAQQTRAWAGLADGKPVPVDANGWPTADCMTVVMDDRPFPEWQCACPATSRPRPAHRRSLRQERAGFARARP